MIVGIHQPNFMPWFGFFAKIWRSDVFVFLDDVASVKTGSSYVNRCQILERGVPRWLTISVIRGHGELLIKDMVMVSAGEKTKVEKTLQSIYGRRPFFDRTMEVLAPFFSSEMTNLCELNIGALESLMKLCGIERKILRSSQLDVGGRSTERLINIVKASGGDTYLSGMGGANYQDETAFASAGIALMKNELIHPIYAQPDAQEFREGLSILDFLFSEGASSVHAHLLALPPPVEVDNA